MEEIRLLRSDLTASQTRIDKVLADNAMLSELVKDLTIRVKALEGAKEAPAIAKAAEAPTFVKPPAPVEAAKP